MTAARKPAILLTLLVAAFVFDVLLTAQTLPPRVATHFDGAGHANGWMSRAGHLRFMLCFGVGLPLFLAGLFYAIRIMPTGLVNMPHRDYWLAPERRADTNNRLFAHGLWLACLMLLFFAAVHHQIIGANRTPTPRLSSEGTIVLLGAFLAGLLVWIVRLYRLFPKPS